MCEWGDLRKQRRDFITQSSIQTPLGSGTFSRLFGSNRQQICVIPGTHLLFSPTFSWLLLVSIDQIVWVTTRNTYPFPYSYAHTEPTRIYIYVCMYDNVHVLILSDMYIRVHTCVHVHTYVVFVCTYVRRYICICMDICVQIYICMHTYVYTEDFTETSLICRDLNMSSLL